MSRLVGAARIAYRPSSVGADVALFRAAIASARRQGVDGLVFPDPPLTDSPPKLDLAGCVTKLPSWHGNR